MRTYSKLISIFITVCFVITNAFAQNFAYAPNIAQNFNINDTSLIPQNLGRITEVNLKDSAKTLIFIQDVHANFQVQENIYKILNILNSKFKIEKVILEGAPYGKINTAALSALPEKISQSIKDNLMQTGYLSGAEMFVSQNEQTSQTAYGIENWDVYLANIYRASDILNDYFSNKSVINAFQSKVFLQTSRSLKGKASKLNSVIINKNFSYNKINDLSKIFNKPLPSIDIQNHVLQNRVHNNINYKNVEKQMSAYLESLKNILPYKNYKAIIDKQFDKAEFYKELYFSAKSTDLSAFVKNYPDLNLFLVSFINSEKTNPLNSYVETENYLNSLISDRTLSKTERELLTLSKMTALLDNFFGLELTPEDYRYFIENLNFYKNFLKTYYPKNKINALLNNEQIIDYYEANISRDGIFLENISSYIKASGGTNIFVSGGFHTEMLKDLNDKDISYIVITPNITQTGSNYKLRISQQGRVSQHDKNALAPIPLLLAPDSSVNEYIRNEYFSSLIGNIIKASDSKNPEALRSIINNWLKDVEEKLQSEGKDFDKLEVSFTKDTFTIKGKTQSITFPIKSGKIVFEDSSLIRTLIAKAGSIFNTSMMVVNNSLGHFLKNEIKFIENNSNISVPVVIIGKKTEITIDESLAKALIQVKEKEGLTKEHEKQLQTAITNIITEAIRNSQSFFPENANPAGNLADEIKITIASKSKHLFSYDKESKTIIVNEIVLKALEMFPKNISALLNACLTHEFIHAVTDIPEKDLEAFEQEQVLRDIENMKNLVGDEEEGKHFTLMMLYIADLSSLIFGNILNAPANENEFMDKILEGSLSITEIRHYAKKFFEYGKTAESVEKEIAFFENLTYKTAPDKPLYNKYLDTIKDKHNENKAKLEKFQKDFETAASKKNQRFAFGMTAGFLKSEVEEALEKLYDSIPTELFEAYYTGSNHYSFTHTVEVLNGIIKLFEMDSKIFSDMKDDEMKALAYAVVMHDISTFIVQDNHERNSSIWAGAILKNLSKDLPKGFSDLVQKICMGHRKIKEDFQPREEHKGYQAARILHDADAIAILENMEIIFDIWNQENTRGMIFDGSKSIAERVNMLKDNLYKGTESGDYINDIVRHFVYRKNEGLFLTEAGKNYIHNNPGGRRALLRFLFGLKEGEEDRESLHDFLNNNNYEKDENSLVEKIKNSGNKVFIPGKPQGTAVTNEDIEVIFDTIEKVIYSLRNIAPTDENVYNPYLNKQSEQTPKAYLEDLISNDRKNEKSLILSDLHGSGDRTLLLLEEVLSYPNSNEPNEKGEKKPAIQISDLANIIKNSDIDKVYVLGDVVDRGEQQADTVKIVEAIMASGKGAYVLGNHDINVLMNLSRMHIPYYDGYKGVIGYETRDAKGDALMNLEEYRKFLVGVATLVKNIHSNINKLEEKYLNTEDPGKKSKIIDDIIKQLTLARNYQFHVDSFMAKAFENKKATAKNLIKRFEREAKSIKIDDSQDSVRIEHKMDLEDKESKELINQLGMRVIEEKGSGVYVFEIAGEVKRLKEKIDALNRVKQSLGNNPIEVVRFLEKEYYNTRLLYKAKEQADIERNFKKLEILDKVPDISFALRSAFWTKAYDDFEDFADKRQKSQIEPAVLGKKNTDDDSDKIHVVKEFEELLRYPLDMKDGKDILTNPSGSSIFENEKDKKSGELLDLLRDLYGHNVGICVYTGFRAAYKMAPNWWKDRIDKLKALIIYYERNYEDKDKDEYKNLVILLKHLQEKAGIVLKEQEDKIERELNNKNYAYPIIAAVMSKVYESVAWYGEDWLRHSKWGEGLKKELLREITAHNILIDESNKKTEEFNKKLGSNILPIELKKKKEEINYVNYLANSFIRKFLAMLTMNANLYQRFPNGDIYLHSVLPIDDEGDIAIGAYDEETGQIITHGVLNDKNRPIEDKNGKRIKGIVYKGKHYTGREVFDAFDLISQDMKTYKDAENLSENNEPFALVNSIYADVTTAIKPANLEADFKSIAKPIIIKKAQGLKEFTYKGIKYQGGSAVMQLGIEEIEKDLEKMSLKKPSYEETEDTRNNTVEGVRPIHEALIKFYGSGISESDFSEDFEKAENKIVNKLEEIEKDAEKAKNEGTPISITYKGTTYTDAVKVLETINKIKVDLKKCSNYALHNSLTEWYNKYIIGKKNKLSKIDDISDVIKSEAITVIKARNSIAGAITVGHNPEDKLDARGINEIEYDIYGNPGFIFIDKNAASTYYPDYGKGAVFVMENGVLDVVEFKSGDADAEIVKREIISPTLKLKSQIVSTLKKHFYDLKLSFNTVDVEEIAVKTTELISASDIYRMFDENVFVDIINDNTASPEHFLQMTRLKSKRGMKPLPVILNSPLTPEKSSFVKTVNLTVGGNQVDVDIFMNTYDGIETLVLSCDSLNIPDIKSNNDLLAEIIKTVKEYSNKKGKIIFNNINKEALLKSIENLKIDVEQLSVAVGKTSADKEENSLSVSISRALSKYVQIEPLVPPVGNNGNLDNILNKKPSNINTVQDILKAA